MASKHNLVVAHDYFTQRGGAERVAATLVQSLQPAYLATSAFIAEQTFPMPETRVETSFIQKIPGLRRDPRRALPLLALAWTAMPPVQADILLCSSSGWSHGLRTGPGTVKIVYCHNPARWLYQMNEYLMEHPLHVKALLRVLAPIMRHWDRRAARSAALYIANSTAVAQRIRDTYGVCAKVIHPPVSFDSEGSQEEVRGLPSSFYLTVGRGRGYKNTQILVDSFKLMPREHLVVVGLDGDSPSPNVTYLAKVSDDSLRWLYARATALMSIAFEDFGLTPIEANSMGTPSLVLRAGGFLDSTAEGISGSFVDSATVDSVIAAISVFRTDWDREGIKRHAAEFSRESFITKIRSVLESESILLS